MAAGQGYAVFYPNYRGSTGRGIDFVYSSQGDLAGSEFDDVVDGVDYLIREGVADGDRIGVTGGSYGGSWVFPIIYPNGEPVIFRKNFIWFMPARGSGKIGKGI